MTWLLLSLVVVGHLFTSYGEVAPTGRIHYWVHTIYALFEPVVIKVADLMASNSFFTENPLGRGILWFVGKSNFLIPHGVVIPTGTAIRLIKDIHKYSGDDAHIAVGPCVCQRVLERYSEPTCKDMTIWYGAEIYRRFFKEEYRLLSVDEAEAMLREFHRLGLTHVVEFCMQSRRWMFVLCSCDTEICCPTRLYNAVGVALYAGPYIARQDQEKCLGEDECGACLTRCNFSANQVSQGKVMLDREKCMGCGLCVTTCQAKARGLEKREGYTGRLLPWEYIEGTEPLSPNPKL